MNGIRQMQDQHTILSIVPTTPLSKDLVSEDGICFSFSLNTNENQIYRNLMRINDRRRYDQQSMYKDSLYYLAGIFCFLLTPFIELCILETYDLSY